MHSQLSNVFFRMEVLDDEIDIYINTTTAKSSILSKRNEHKNVRWEESIIDNEYKHIIQKATYLAELSQELTKLHAKFVEQEDLIKRQVGEVTRLKGLWAQAQKGKFQRDLNFTLQPSVPQKKPTKPSKTNFGKFYLNSHQSAASQM